ncbi:MAG: phosphonate metabolism protein/1,5-bisphosphokinase (PRPP-forming) PhnN [Pseudomonadota bacterium]
MKSGIAPTGSPRYALYYVPGEESLWWQAGCHWLGRDARSGIDYRQVAVNGVPAVIMRQLTSQARRYGFHATLKAPFRLAEGFSEADLMTMAQAFASVQPAITLREPGVRPLGDFLAIRPQQPQDEIAALAMRCVSYFDLLRASPTPAELARRRHAGLSPRQESLLQRWGYPYTEEEFRFHMTLTDTLGQIDADALFALRNAAESHFAEASASPLLIDSLSIFKEEQPGAPFSLWQHFPFARLRSASRSKPMQMAPTSSAIPPAGRLFFIVGPSGVGKDSLLRWAEQHMLAGAKVVFAQRTITRAPQQGESHEAVDENTFWKAAASGHFAMMWQAHDLCYGIRRGIEADLKAGHDVIINGSREYIAQLRQLFPHAHVIWIEADDALVQHRITHRKREAGAALLRRLHRSSQFVPPDSGDLIRFDNSGPIELAGQRLLNILSGQQ